MSDVSVSYERDELSEVYVTDRTGDRLSSLSTANIEDVKWVLDDYGTASFAMPAEDPRNADVILGQTEVLIFIENVPWWGRVSRVRTNFSESVYECSELLSYYELRFLLTASLNYTSVDQLSIAVAIHELAQTGDLRSFGITTGSFDASGKVRSRKYDRWQHPNLLDLLKEFPTLDDGFDFGIEYDGAGNRDFVCYYPRKGTIKSNYSLVLGKNITEFDVVEDADSLATKVYATGGSTGSVKFEASAEDVPQATFFGTHYEDVVSEGDQKDVDWLADAAAHAVSERKQVIPVVTVTVADDPVKIFGNLLVGDSTRVIIKRGRININNVYRVMEFKRNHAQRVNEIVLVFDE